MKRILWMLLLDLSIVGGLSGCVAPASKNSTAEAIRHEMDAMTRESAKDVVNNALLPPLSISMPKADSKLQEPRFDLAVNNTPASQVFMAIASGTRYNMLVPPEVTGNISLNLKNVTVTEALDAIRELYGYEYRIDASRIYIQPIDLQTRLFHVSYLTATRTGSSTLTVDSGGGTSGSGTSSSGTSGTTGSSGGAGNSTVTTTSGKNDFWNDLKISLDAIVGNKPGRSVVINGMSGVIVVRAMPDEMRDVMNYLRASQISIERQVILEAKIVEVQLNEGFQSGVNWGAFRNNPNSRLSVAQVSPGGSLAPNAGLNDGTVSAIPGGIISSVAGATGSLFGLAFQTSNFSALLDFLETQGNVHVLSSPRIATLNNQKAILKVGTDQYFVTGFTAGTLPTQSTPGTAPTPTYSPMFAGIALDVTPSINENNDVILHVHPSVSQISSQNVPVTGGTVPMATTSISETDSVIRARDGQVVVIGGLMTQQTQDGESGLPGLPKMIFGHTSRTTQKTELILLLKPTVVDSDLEWADDIAHSRDRMNSMASSLGK